MHCKKHPRYIAKRRPQVACQRCWKIFLEHCSPEQRASLVTKMHKQLLEAQKREMLMELPGISGPA